LDPIFAPLFSLQGDLAGYPELRLELDFYGWNY
jgi:hypothetical protein